MILNFKLGKKNLINQWVLEEPVKKEDIGIDPPGIKRGNKILDIFIAKEFAQS